MVHQRPAIVVALQVSNRPLAVRLRAAEQHRGVFVDHLLDARDARARPAGGGHRLQDRLIAGRGTHTTARSAQNPAGLIGVARLTPVILASGSAPASARSSPGSTGVADSPAPSSAGYDRARLAASLPTREVLTPSGRSNPSRIAGSRTSTSKDDSGRALRLRATRILENSRLDAGCCQAAICLRKRNL